MPDRSARGKTKSQRSEARGNAKSGQVLVRTRSSEKGRPVAAPDETCATMRGCSSIASNTGATHLQRKTQKADRFWFAPGAAKKAGQWRLRTRRVQPCGAVPRSPQTPEPRTFNGKRKKRTGFGSHPGRRKRQASGGSGRDAAATMRGCSSIASNTGAAHLQRKTQKNGQVLVRTREDKTESIDYFKEGMSGVLNLVANVTTAIASLW